MNVQLKTVFFELQEHQKDIYLLVNINSPIYLIDIIFRKPCEIN